MSNAIFRAMQVEDLPIIKKIEKACFTAPWSMQAYLNELTGNHLAHYIVTTVNNNIVAYCGSWIVFDEAQITTIATHPGYQGKGLGEATLRYMMNLLEKKGARTLFLEVRVSNEGAQRLYRKLEFQKIGIRKKYYADNQEDAIVMGVNLGGSKQRITRSWD